MWTLWAGDPKNLHTSFFVKNFYLDLNFFEVLQIAVLKNEKKKKMQTTLKLLDIARYKRKALKKEKEKQKKRNWFSIGLIEAVLRTKILGNRLVIST